MRIHRMVALYLLINGFVVQCAVADPKTDDVEALMGSCHRSMRLVVDACSFDFDLILRTADQPWIVADFSGITKGFSIRLAEDASGNLRDVDAGKPRTLEGSVEVLIDLTKKHVPPKRTYYQSNVFTFVRVSNGTGFPPENLEDRLNFDEYRAGCTPLDEGGVVICRTSDQEKPDAASFRPMFLISRSWLKWVEPAFEYFREKPVLLQAGSAAQNQEALVECLTHDNPFVALSACRVLAKAHLLTSDMRRKATLVCRGLRQAAVIQLILDNSTQASQPQVVEELAQIIRNAGDADQIWGIGFASMNTSRLASSSSIIPIIEALLAKASAWGVKTQADKNLAWILKRATDALKQLKESQARTEAFLRPAKEFAHKEIAAILAPGRAANSKDEDGTPILMIAIQRGYADAAKELLKRGADVRAGDRSGNTPFSDAAVLGNVEILQLLLDKGGSVNGRFGSNWTPLMNAACFGRWEAAKFLLDKGADVKPANDNGNTALTLAAASFPEIVKLLLSQKAEVNHATKAGKTALMVAAEKRQIESVKILLVSGALTDVKDKDGETALSIAEKKGFTEIVEVLKNWKPAQAGAVVKPPS